jgi:hypothetical protein
MTRGQEAFSIDFAQSSDTLNLKDVNQDGLIVINPNSEELQAHNDFILNLKIKNQ